ncbi:hypothetical protein BVRB_1g002140 [Beta vulgaris subsp. vulgaris]|nr:hypothetical protein BVRB_1g002140 [Beta vulgaris subsp. vulgaris]
MRLFLPSSEADVCTMVMIPDHDGVVLVQRAMCQQLQQRLDVNIAA